MAFIDTYFGGNYQDYLNYFGEKWDTQYKYVLEFVDDSEILILKENPIGWDKLNIKFLRNWTYYTVWRNFALSLKFPKTDESGGIRILESEAAYGIVAKTNIYIYERDGQTNNYEEIYRGALDYKPGKYREERDNVVVGIKDGTIEELIKTREDINYNVFNRISSDGIEMPEIPNFLREVLYPQIDIFQSSDGIFRHLEDLQWTQDDADTVYEHGIKIVPEDYLSNEIGKRISATVDELTDDSSVVLYKNDTGGIVRIINNRGFYNRTYENDSTVKLSGPAHTDTNDVPFFFVACRYNQFYGVYDENGDEVELIKKYYYDKNVIMTNYKTGLNPKPLSRSRFTQYEFELQDGWEIRYFTRVWISGLPEYDGTNAYTIDYHCETANEFEYIKEISIGSPASNVGVIYPDELFTRLAQLMTSQLDTAKLFYSPELGRPDSPFVVYNQTGEHAEVGLTKGKIIRGYPNEPLSTSLKEMFKTYNGLGNFCLWYNRELERIEIRAKSFAFDRSYLMFDLGEVTKFTREPMSRAYFNKILAGYKTQQYEEINGANEYNAKAEYSEVMLFKGQYDVRIPINGDGTSQEICRRFNYTNYASEDTKYDENLYIIHAPNYVAEQGGDNVSGYDGAEQNYNLKYTPRRNLVRHGNVLQTSLYLNSEPVRFNFRDKNTQIEYDDPYYTRVSEDAPITKDELAAKGFNRLFEPFIYKFERPFNRDILNIMRINGNGFLRFNFDGVTYECFVDIAECVDYPLRGKWTGIAKVISEGDNKVFENGDNHVLENDDNRILE